jgi:hypothetical protein
VHRLAKSSGPDDSLFDKIAYSNQEARRAKRQRHPTLLSNAAVSGARAIRPKHTFKAGHELCTEIRNWWKSSAEMIRARADLRAGFKRCCMKTGKQDGSNRAYFF